MALNWNVEKCDNYKTLVNEDEWAVTNALIWATMAVGIREITKANFQKFYDRVHEIETTRGSWLRMNGKPSYIKLADVKKRIGLYTNAGTFTDAQFRRNQARALQNK